MKKLVTFVSDLRTHTMLCCSAAVLLTACGGASEPRNEQEPLLSAQTTGILVEQQGPTITAPDSEAATAAAIGEQSAPVADSDVEQALVAAEDVAPALAAEVDTASTAESDMTSNTAPADGSTRLLAEVADTEDAIIASTYHLYVSTSGADTNNGSAQSPFRTIGRAARAARPSTTVHVAKGTYRENVKTTVHGSAKSRIRYVSDTKWGAKVIGSGTEAMWTNSGNYSDISGFDISGSGRLGVLNNGSYTLVSGNHIHHIMVSGGCNGSGGAGVVNGNYSASDGDIIGNIVHDIGVPGKCNGVQGIYSSNLRGNIMNNIVYRVSSYGIHLWHAADNVLIANNTVFANGSASMGGGIVIGAGDSPGGVVLNNTRVINNLVYKNPAAGIKQYCYSGVSCIGPNNVTANNLVFGNGRAIIMRVGAATGTITADPLFVNYKPNGTGAYRVRKTSPAVNRGTVKGAPSYDIGGTQRRMGAPDIGAFENF